MLTKTVLVSSLAAVALAEAAAEPRITQAPVRRQFGEAGDEVDEFLDNAGTAVGDLVDGAGSNIDDIISRASTMAGGLGDDVSSLISQFGGGVSGIEECTSALKSLTGDMPAPTGDLGEALASAGLDDRETDICKIAEDLDDDEKEEWESFRSSASSWYAENSNAVSSARNACPTIPLIDDLVGELDCITGESTSNNNDDDDDDDSSAMRVTGLAMAAAGAAVGAVAVML